MPDNAVIFCQRVEEEEIRLTFSHHPTGPWCGYPVVSTDPDDQEVVARLHDGERVTRPRAYPSYPVFVQVRMPGCLAMACGKMEPGKQIEVQRVGTTIMFPAVMRLTASDNG